MFKLKSQYVPHSSGNAGGQITWADSKHDLALLMFIFSSLALAFHRQAERNLAPEGVGMADLDIRDPIDQFGRTKLQLGAPAKNEPSCHPHLREEPKNAPVR
jgi:hypothetical protein